MISDGGNAQGTILRYSTSPANCVTFQGFLKSSTGRSHRSLTTYTPNSCVRVEDKEGRDKKVGEDRATTLKKEDFPVQGETGYAFIQATSA